MLLHQGLAEHIMCRRKERVQDYCFPALFYRFVQTMRHEKFFCQISANARRERIQTLCLLYFGNSFGLSPQRGQMPAVPLVASRVARAKLDSSRELRPGRLPIPVEVIQAKCERDVSFAESTVQPYGFGRRRFRFWVGFPG